MTRVRPIAAAAPSDSRLHRHAAPGRAERIGRAAWRRVPACVLALLVGSLAACVRPAGVGERDAWRATRIGLCEDYPEETRSLAAARADLELAQRAGATVLRIAFGWDAIESERGRYDWSFWDEFVTEAASAGVELIPYVCYTPRWAAKDAGEDFWRSPPRDPQDFRRFMEAIVQRYRTRIRTWELWNEPDNAAYWTGSVEEFAALIRAGAAGVRDADPTARVVFGGIATELDFLEAAFRDHGVAADVDVVNLHAYLETWHPDPIETLPDYIEQAAEIVAEFGEAEPLWLAETGYSSVGGRRMVSQVYRARYRGEHSEEAQAGALARTLFLALGTGRLPLVAWYRINDLPVGMDVIGDDNNHRLGLRRTDGRAKPALQPFAELAQLFAGEYRVIEPDVAAEPGSPETEAEVRAFALRDGRRVIAAWLKGMGSAEDGDDLQPDLREASVRVTMPLGAGEGRVARHAAAGAPADAREIGWRRSRAGAEVSFQLRGQRVLWCVWRP